MSTKPETETPAPVVKEQKAMEQQEQQMANKHLPPAQLPAGNRKEHPSRRR